MYIMKNEQKSGPVTKDQFLAMVASGLISRSTLISRDGENWKLAASFAGIKWPEINSADFEMASNTDSSATPTKASANPTTPKGPSQGGGGDYKAVARDVLIIFALTFSLGIMVGVSGAEPGVAMVFIGLGNVFILFVSSTVSGALAKGSRFRHLFRVATGLVGCSFLNVLFFGVPIGTWFVGALVTFVVMALGGGLSFLFVKAAR